MSMNARSFRPAVLAAMMAAAGFGLVACNSEDGEKTTTTVTPATATTPETLTVERTIEGKVRARVRALDLATRRITLEDEQIHAMTFTVGPQVKRLDEVRPGDSVNLAYTATLTAELRPPTAEERATPIAIVDVGGRADKPADPAAVSARGMKVVTTVEAIDIPNMRVTLKGPMGNQYTARARSEENMKKLRIGDTIVITYVEGVAIALDRANW